MLRRVYGSATFGYTDFTQAILMTKRLVDEKDIKKTLSNAPFPRDLVRQLLHRPQIDMQDIQDWCSWDRGDAQNLLSFLVRKHALQRDSRRYRKTSPFINLLKALLEGDELVDRPDFLPEDF
jgi:hypothetical protein